MRRYLQNASREVRFKTTEKPQQKGDAEQQYVVFVLFWTDRSGVLQRLDKARPNTQGQSGRDNGKNENFELSNSAAATALPVCVGSVTTHLAITASPGCMLLNGRALCLFAPLPTSIKLNEWLDRRMNLQKQLTKTVLFKKPKNPDLDIIILLF